MVAVRNVELARLSEEVSRLRIASKRGRVPKELQRRVLNLVTSGHSIGQVAKSCGLSASAIYKWRNDLRHSFRSEDRVRRLAIVPEHTKQSSASSLCHARIVVKGIVIEIDLDRLPDVIAALRELP